MQGWATVLFVDYVFVFEFILPWLGHSTHAYAHIGAFQTVVFFILAAYIKAATTDPGSVPVNTVS
jgi:hypothetical protein